MFSHYLQTIVLTFILLSYCSGVAFADVQADYERAKITYVNAMVALATYSGRVDIIAREELAEGGWFMRPYNEQFHGADAKFFLVERAKLENDKEIYMLAVTGTENISDLKTDLNFSKVFFGGTTPETFAEQAQRRDLTNNDPMVHRGFNNYTQAAFFMNNAGKTYGELMLELLAEDKNRKLYMVGHSLGGAVVTLGAARLIAMGADPAQIEVITFGAPAVGNAAFAKQYGAAVPLTRIVMNGDPVQGVLQTISGGYTQFGEQVVWHEKQEPEKRHSIMVYVDAANRNYYDARKAMAAAGVDSPDMTMIKTGEPMVYVSPLNLRMNKELMESKPYIKETIIDSLRSSLAGFVIGTDTRGSIDEELIKAKASGCKWLLQANLRTEKVRHAQNEIHISYQETIYAVDSGKLQGAYVYTNGTRRLTPLMATLYDVVRAKIDREKIIKSD